VSATGRITAATLADADLPALYRAADASSLDAQTNYGRRVAATLVFAVAGAAAGAAGVDWGAAAAFFVSLVMQLDLARNRPERGWYEGRALAESAKSLGWQYAVAGGDYGRRHPDPEKRLHDELRQLVRDFPGRAYETPAEDADIRDAMRLMRKSDLETRREGYRAGRIRDQREWYADKATWNRMRARMWSAWTLAFQVAAVLAAMLKATDTVDVDLLGVLSAIVAALVGWVQLKDHTRLAEAYALASRELAAIDAEIGGATTEEAWEQYVASAEQAISREHRMWRAARAVRSD
jgi:hypothetical protein